MCGENAFSPDKAILTAAHPRVCGENELLQERWARARGSSPRVRGKRVGNRCVSTWKGLIPACAGKTILETALTIAFKAHPRVCGENPITTGVIFTLPGSSPRVRGKLDLVQNCVIVAGLIPACAGKTAPQRPHRNRRWAHPRVCGENTRLELARVFEEGSSPRVRGKLLMLNTLCLNPRLIPACAGKTKTEARVQIGYGAHPRVCGENSGGRAPVWKRAGSSPRVRGKRLFQVAGHLYSRLIPACAGKTG